MLRISFFGTLPPIQGISGYCAALVDKLQTTCEIEFITFSAFAPRWFYAGSTDHEKGIFDFKKWANVTIRPILRWYNPFSWIAAGLSISGDVFHVQYWNYLPFPAIFTMVVFSKLRGKKIIVTFHNVVSHESNILDKICGWILARFSDAQIVHSISNRTDLIRTYSVSPASVNVISMGTFDYYSKTGVSRDMARKKLGIPPQANVMLFFGNLRPYKGVEDLISAFLAAKKKNPALYLIIAGTPWNVEYGAKIAHAAKGEESIRLVAEYIPFDQVETYFSASDLVTLPYRHFSSQSGVGNIALAFDKPLLVSDAGGLTDLTPSPETIFPAGDRVELQKRIEYLFSRKRILSTLAKKMVQHKTKFDWKQIAIQTELMYANLLEEK